MAFGPNQFKDRLGLGGVCTLIALHCGCVIFNIALEAELTEHSVKVGLFLFPFAIGECNLIYFECVEVFSVHICRIFSHS